MIYDILDVNGEKIPDNRLLSNDNSGPIFMFIGGLFNLAGYENGAPFKKMLDNLSSEGNEKAQAFYIQEKTMSPWEEKVYDGYLFEKDGKASTAAVELAHAIFLPADTMKKLSQTPGTPAFEDALTDLRNRFSRITLMGYSAGTAIIRQIEACVVGELEKTGLTDNEIKSVVQCGVALDVGPIYSVSDTRKTLTHFVTAHRDDMMTHKLGVFMGDFPFPDPSEGAPVTAGEIGNSLILVPEIGSPTVRLVSQDAADPSAPRVHYNRLEEAHDLLMYTNTRENLEIAGKTISTYSSLPTAQLVKEFKAKAINASAEAIAHAAPRNGPALLEDFQRVNLDPRRLQKLAKEFRREERYFEREVAHGKTPELKKSIWNPPPFLQKLEKELKAGKLNPSTPHPCPHAG